MHGSDSSCAIASSRFPLEACVCVAAMPLPARQKGESAKAPPARPSADINWGAVAAAPAAPTPEVGPNELVQLQLQQQMAAGALAGGRSFSDPGGRKKGANPKAGGGGGRTRESETVWASTWKNMPASCLPCDVESPAADGLAALLSHLVHRLRTTSSAAS